MERLFPDDAPYPSYRSKERRIGPNEVANNRYYGVSWSMRLCFLFLFSSLFLFFRKDRFYARNSVPRILRTLPCLSVVELHREASLFVKKNEYRRWKYFRDNIPSVTMTWQESGESRVIGQDGRRWNHNSRNRKLIEFWPTTASGILSVQRGKNRQIFSPYLFYRASSLGIFNARSPSVFASYIWG